MGGAREGVAVIQFYDDYYFECYQVLVPKKTSHESDAVRYDTLSDRTGTASTSTNAPATQLFGSGPTDGTWFYDNSGKLFGFFPESSDSLTNGISFTGTVVPGKRLSLLCSTAFGRVTYKGVPATQLQDISGAWSGIAKEKKTNFKVSRNELFVMAPAELSYVIPNLYEVAGIGAGYTYEGYALLSAQKRFALSVAVGENQTNGPLRAVSGPFNPTKLISTMKGWEQAAGRMTNNAQFKVSKLLQ